MQLKKAKEYFEMGFIHSFVAVKDKANKGNWLLHIHGLVNAEKKEWILQTVRNKEKIFSSLDTLIKDIETIVAGDIDSLIVNPKQE